MPRTYYCTAADVLRKFDPTLSVGDLDSNSFIGANDLELVNAAIEDAEGEFEDKTGNPYREVRQGVPGRPATYEHHDADFRRYQGGVKFYLDHVPFIPLDKSQGDVLEIRTGRDSWREITDDRNQLWEANHRDGWIRIRSVHRYHSTWQKAALDNNIRVSYRYGTLGGDSREAGQSTLDSAVAEGDQTLDVVDAARVPREGLLLIGSLDGGTDDEYVRFRGRDLQNDQLTNVARGRRGTSDQSHESGATVHYCPVNIRQAVASKAAIELLQYDDWVAQLAESDQTIDPKDKRSNWQQTWKSALGKHSEVRML